MIRFYYMKVQVAEVKSDPVFNMSKASSRGKNGHASNDMGLGPFSIKG